MTVAAAVAAIAWNRTALVQQIVRLVAVRLLDWDVVMMKHWRRDVWDVDVVELNGGSVVFQLLWRHVPKDMQM